MVLRQVHSSARSLPATVEWIDEISVDRYRPMLRLLSRDDLRFLRDQPDYSPRMEAKLRVQRAQIFADYLKRMSEDFSRICGALKLLTLQADRDRPDLAAQIVQAQFAFIRGMYLARVNVLLYRVGIGSVDAAALLRIFSSMHIELQGLVPATGAAMA
jgi:hypothetical protein